MQLEDVVKKLIRFLKTRLEALSMSVTSGGVDSMEKYQYMLGQARAYQYALQEISNLLNDKEQNEGNVVDINTKNSLTK